MGLMFTCVSVRHLFGLLRRFFWAYNYVALLGLIDTLNNPIERYNLLLAAHLPTPPTPLIHPPLIHQICDITVVIQKVITENSAVLAMYLLWIVS